MQVKSVAQEHGERYPVQFRLGARDYFVREILDQWCGRPETFYKVLADDGNHYILRHTPDDGEGTWDLASFREASREQANS